MQTIRPFRSYLFVALAFAVAGFLLSFAAQGGGIGPVNGFIAPIIGPWSRLLEPNADRFRDWELNNYIFALSVTFLTAALVMASSVPRNRAVRILLELAAHAAVVFWCWCGMIKVMVELS